MFHSTEPEPGTTRPEAFVEKQQQAKSMDRSISIN
jgi:hypothetical protein